MLEEFALIAAGKKEFDAQVKNYFVNMTNNTRTLHKTYQRSCPYSKCSYKYITFDTLEEVKEFEKRHLNATPFKRCGNCFKKN